MLGQYATVVLSAWGVSLAALVLLVGLSFARARRVKAQLDAIERQREGG